MTQWFLCLGQKNMVSVTRWFCKINWVATSQRSTVVDNPATLILEINSIPIPLPKSIAQKTIKKLCCMYGIVRSLSYKLNCL